MENKQVKRWSALFITKALQIKTIRKYHSTLIKMEKIQNTDNMKCL